MKQIHIKNEYLCCCAGMIGIISLIGIFSILSYLITINNENEQYDYSNSIINNQTSFEY